MSKHFIQLATAKQMTKKYREDKKKVIKDEYKDKDILPICETFERDAFDKVLALSGCTGIRIYLGMNDTLKTSFIIVGVDATGEDILTPIAADITKGEASPDMAEMQTMDDPIIDDGNRCPDKCPTNLL